jgi:hypothetical protein
MAAVLCAPMLRTRPGTPVAPPDGPEPQFDTANAASHIEAFSVEVSKGTGLAPTVFPHSIQSGKTMDARPVPVAVPAPASEPVSASSLRLADGDAFPLIISIPAGPAWRDVFRRFGGAVGVSTSSSPRPAYLNHTISPDGHLDEESVPTTGRFLFRLSEEAVRVVNETLEPAARIAPGQSAFGVFAGPFRSVVAGVLQDFCAAAHVSPDDLASVHLELGPGFGLRVASTTRRDGKF